MPRKLSNTSFPYDSVGVGGGGGGGGGWLICSQLQEFVIEYLWLYPFGYFHYASYSI